MFWISETEPLLLWGQCSGMSLVDLLYPPQLWLAKEMASAMEMVDGRTFEVGHTAQLLCEKIKSTDNYYLHYHWVHQCFLYIIRKKVSPNGCIFSTEKYTLKPFSNILPGPSHDLNLAVLLSVDIRLDMMQWWHAPLHNHHHTGPTHPDVDQGSHNYMYPSVASLNSRHLTCLLTWGHPPWLQVMPS